MPEMQPARTVGPKAAFTQAALLAAVFAAESALFWVMAARDHAWIYPRWFDQLQYLGNAYDSFELERSRGFAAAAWQALTQVSPQGCLQGVLALVAFSLAGPSRGAALM